MSYMRPGWNRKYFKGLTKEYAFPTAQGNFEFASAYSIRGEDMAEIILDVLKHARIRIQDSDFEVIKKLAKEFGVEHKLRSRPLSDEEICRRMFIRVRKIERELGIVENKKVKLKDEDKV